MTDLPLAEVIDPSVLAERRARRSARSLGDALADARRQTLAVEQDAIGSLRATPGARVSVVASLEAELVAAREERDTLAAQLLGAREDRDRIAADLAAERALRESLAEELAGLRAAERQAREALTAATDAAKAQQQRLASAVASEQRARRAVEADLERHARAQVAASAALPARAPADAARIAADLDRAAATLRARAAGAESGAAPDLAVAPTSPAAPDRTDAPASAAEVDAVVAASRPVAAPARARSPEGRSLRAALVELARRDPATAGQLLVGLLPAQGPIVAASLDYDLTIRGTGTFAVTLAGGAAEVRALAAPRGRRAAAFHLIAEPLALAELIAGDRRRVRRLGRQVRITGSRRLLAPLTAVSRAHVGLADLARAGATLDPLATLRALPEVVPAAWTAGHAFAVEHVVDGDPPRSLILRARDGEGLEALDRLDGGRPDATVTLTADAFAAMLAEAPIPAGHRPAIRGSWQAVAVLLGWADRARGR